MAIQMRIKMVETNTIGYSKTYYSVQYKMNAFCLLWTTLRGSDGCGNSFPLEFQTFEGARRAAVAFKDKNIPEKDNVTYMNLEGEEL